MSWARGGPGTTVYSGETEMHFDARRQQQHNGIKGLRATGVLDTLTQTSRMAGAHTHTPKPLGPYVVRQTPEKVPKNRPEETGVDADLIPFVPPQGDIGWNKTETRMFTKPTQHEFSETYEQLPTDAYRKLAEKGRKWGIGEEGKVMAPS